MAFDGLQRDKHVLKETNYCATMYEQPRIDGRPRCTNAGRYMDTDGRVICGRCAAGLLVVKLTDIPKLIEIVDRLVDVSQTDELRAELRALVARATEVLP